MQSSIRQSLIVAGIAIYTSLSPAQTFFGSIVGTVTDASGASVPETSVSLTNLGTAERRTALTDGNGSYQFVNLVPGNYKVDAEKVGFRHFTRDSVRVEVQSVIRIDAALEVGDVSQVMEVKAETPLLKTETSSLDQIVGTRAVQDMPLNGRNPLNLVGLVPGVVPQGSSTGNPLGNQLGGAFTNPNGWGNYQIGGGIANQSGTYFDGAPLNVSYTNSVILVPTQDSIQEFRVATNNVSPEFGRFAGGVVNLTTKSGTNEFHGGLYEYLRNNVLNANNFFNNSSGLARPEFTQNQYGANIGGAAIKDKTFFFFGWESFSLRQGLPVLTTVPTAAQRAGDFSGLSIPIFDPLTTCGLQGVPACPAGQATRLQFPGNAIPASRIDPTAKIMANFWGLPNLPGTLNNFATNAGVGGDQKQFNARGDQALSDKQRLFGRYTYWDGTSIGNDPFRNKTGGPPAIYATNQAVLGDTYTFTPTTIGDFRVSYLRFRFNFTPLDYGVDLATFGPAYAALKNQVTFPELPTPQVTGIYAFNFTDTTVTNTNDVYSLSGSLTKISGRHTLKFGGEARRIEWYYAQSNTSSGNFSFNNGFTSQNPLAPGNTGYGFASLLLGYPASGNAAQPTLSASLQYYHGYYVSDSFQVSKKLTLNLGLRWEYPGAFEERYDRLTVLLPNAPDPLASATGLPLRGQVALVNSPLWRDRHYQTAHWRLFAPRVGYAYRLTDKTVLRGGYGISYLPSDVAFSMAPYTSPVASATTTMVASLDGGLTPHDTLSNPFPTGFLQPPGHNPAALSTLEGQVPSSPIPDQRYPYVQQWNWNVEHEFRGIMFEAGYAGSRGTHLPIGSLNLNQLSSQYASLGGALLTPVSNPFAGVLPANAGLLAAPTVTQGQLLRPYPQFRSLTAQAPTLGDSIYHSLQTRLEKRFRSGGILLASYTWSKFISTTDTLTSWLEGTGVGGIQNNNNLRGERSLTSFDVPHRAVVSYVLDLPIGKGKRLLANASGLENKLVSGWGINGITTFQSGFPLPFTSAQASVFSSTFGGGGSRPNVIAGCDKSVSGSAQSRLTHWFNTACFSQPPQFGFGNESRTDPNLRSSGINTWDVSLFKSTPITERVALQFRAEFFNLFNRVQFGSPGTALGTAQFGLVTSQLNQPRLIQFALRLQF